MKTLVGSPDPERPRNELVWTSTNTDGTGGGNVRIDWVGLNRQR